MFQVGDLVYLRHPDELRSSELYRIIEVRTHSGGMTAFRIKGVTPDYCFLDGAWISDDYIELKIVRDIKEEVRQGRLQRHHTHRTAP